MSFITRKTPLILGTTLIASTLTLATPLSAQEGAAEATQSAASLEVRFEGIEAPRGQIMLALFDSAAAHDGGGEPVRGTAAEVKGDKATVRFEGLAPGTYAIKAFHDLDGDGEMDTNPFGMPIEPFAFSNNAKPQGGPPRWDAASFVVEAGANSISITIK